MRSEYSRRVAGEARLRRAARRDPARISALPRRAQGRVAAQRLIAGALRVVTFGAQTSYLTNYQTTIGHVVYVTPDWMAISAAQRIVTLRHERVHLRQFRRYTLPGMALLYLLVPLPVGLA